MKLIGSIKEYGVVNFFYRLKEKVQNKYIGNDEVIDDNEIKYADVDFLLKPMISVVVPIYNTPKVFLEEMIESVLDQTYDNFQLCLLNGGSTNKEIDVIITNYALRDSRITYIRQEVNEGIAKNTNNAIKMAKGEFVALLDHDDLLTKDALMECVKVINKSNPDIIYSDEDKVTSDGMRFLQPHYKPDWSPDTLKSYNYICHLLVVRKKVLQQANLFRDGVDGSQDYDLILRLSNITKSIVHIPKILYHWRISGNSTAGNSFNKSYAFHAGKRALEDYFKELEIKATVARGSFPGSYDIEYANLCIDKKVMVIFSGEWRTDEEMLECYNNIGNSIQRKKTNIFMINKFKKQDQNSRLNLSNNNIFIINSNNYIREMNDLIKRTEDEYIFIVDANIKITNENWIDIMLGHAQNPDTVILGPKITYKNKIYSYGIGIIKNRIIDIHKGKHRKFFGYFGRARISQNVTAVSPEFTMFKRSFFETVGGFGQEYLSLIAFYEFCLKAKNENKFVKLIPIELGETKRRNENGNFSEEDLKLFFKRNNRVLTEKDLYFPIMEKTKKDE